MKELENTILYVIDQASKAAKQYSQNRFDELGIDITVEQWVILKVIEETKTLSQNELAKATQRDPASITRTLDLLQKKGFVKRTAFAANRRQFDVSLTAKGHEFVKRHTKTVNELRKLSVKGFSKNEINELNRLLNKIRENFS